MPMPCEWCDSIDHTSFYCRYKPRKPIRKIGKESLKWLRTRKKWFLKNPPNDEGYYVCYLCSKWMLPEETTLDHVIPRSHAPQMRYQMSNLKPACSICNNEKGSKIYEENS